MKVVVAIDDKPSAQAITDALVKMHWFDGTELHLVAVLEEDVDYGATGKVPCASPEELENLALELRKLMPHCEVFFFPRQGRPKEIIVGLSREIAADLIVVGSNCKSTLERLMLGSVCQSVVNEAHCPVLVAKTPCCLAREVSPAFRNILVPIDNSVFTDVAVNWLANFDWAASTTFFLAAAVQDDTNLSQVYDSLNRRAGEVEKIAPASKIITETIEGSAGDSILELAKTHYIDLIVIGTHGRTGLKKLILGELADSVTQKAPCAVAIVGGIAHSDEGWIRTEDFDKAKPVVTPRKRSQTIESGRNDLSVHVIPGGF